MAAHAASATLVLHVVGWTGKSAFLKLMHAGVWILEFSRDRLLGCCDHFAAVSVSAEARESY